MNDDRTSHRLGSEHCIKIIYDKLKPDEKRCFKELIVGDPLKKIYLRVTLSYLLIMGVALLWPFDFALIERNSAQWSKDPSGIFFPDAGQLISDGPTRSLFDHIQNGSGLTVEVWLETASVDQTGPARIISYSLDPNLRNFTLGQSFDQLIFRLRSTETNLNGTRPHLVVDDVFGSQEMLHIVVTYDFNEQLVFINGELRNKTDFLKGDFSNWDPGHKLVFGNEATGDRPWIGKIYCVAIYNLPLDGREIQGNYARGLDRQKCKDTLASDAFHGISARYVFAEQEGDRVLNRVSNVESLPLTLPQFIQKNKAFFSVPERISISRHLDHFIMNVMIFIPLGFLVHATFRSRYGNAGWCSVLSVAAGVSFAFAAETIQYFSLTRDSSSLDIGANSLGVVVGVICDRIYANYLQRRARILSDHV